MPTYRRTPLSAVTVLIALAALLVTAAFALARPARSATSADTAATTAPVKIMPLGDSITAGPGCWRAILWHDLQTNGYTNIDFVGSVPDGGCNYGYTYDGDNEGHGGYSATGIANQNQLPAWLSAANPDIVLMHLGTNDMWGGSIPVSSVLAAYTTLIGQMRANNPRMKILVAQIIPMNPPSCPTCAAEVQSLDQAIPGWAAGLTTAQSPIVVVDQWTGFDDATDTGGDGVHPNDAGFAKMAARWYPPLAQVLSGIIPPPPSPSASPSGSPSSSPSSSPSTSASPSSSAGHSGCTAAYQVTSQWGGGFQGTVTVTNSSAAASSAWTVTFTFANGQQVTQSWNTTLSQSGATVTANNAAYNGSLAAGASTSFGFLASWNGTNAVPSISCTLSG
ncbi:cellulose binding domain-containing protein [Actinocrinis sp.]|uniref:cellulose binding domain-containing protein n=1 Tax=Actinocrinis sp. TaxID=1920516 RepID=UPI002BE573B0|nr:cellulose binding domain-containing protein [Actinocrinis sp.]HXR74060.1 cellulose binding domain-containing protein [Actinocrinis sp.]